MERYETKKIAYYERSTFRLSNQDKNLADNKLYLEVEIDRGISEIAKM